ncbi:Uu.00g111060.m01.CDS01 [Anthostomella pinea]|uniref:Uu.00g111060.m01.CDS01 n=1 Tax=Anthostomella pinea TaxID=933095 RepID=A0AAI8VEX6_9PEZI|nr:Uu.00g111060.m01.CDS01 [Anthostomella pinea]
MICCSSQWRWEAKVIQEIERTAFDLNPKLKANGKGKGKGKKESSKLCKVNTYDLEVLIEAFEAIADMGYPGGAHQIQGDDFTPTHPGLEEALSALAVIVSSVLRGSGPSDSLDMAITSPNPSPSKHSMR